MSVVQGLKGTLGIIDAAASILNVAFDKNNPRDQKALKQLGGYQDKLALASTVAGRLDRAGGAITQLSSQTTILSRAFIDESIIDEAILPNLMKAAHEWYAAQIMSSLHLQHMIDDKTTVQNVMSIVQSGHNVRDTGLLQHGTGMITSVLAKRKMGMESFLANYNGDIALEAHDPADPFVLKTKQEIADLEKERDHYKAEAEGVHNKHIGMVQDHKIKAALAPNDQTIKSVSTSDNRIGPMGELYEIKMSNPNGNGQSVVVPLFIQMQPSIVPADIAPRFIDLNVAPTVWQRWTQMRSGELTFWRDFLLQRDMGNRFKSMIKDPRKAQAFSEFLKMVAKKDKYAIDDATDTLGSRQSSNLANSVMVFSEDSVVQAKADSGVDLHKDSDRQRYFRDTYTMIIMIIDPLHQRVTIYFNGLDGDINASYSEFRPKDSKFDPKDFMTALQAFSTNNIGRMR